MKKLLLQIFGSLAAAAILFLFSSTPASAHPNAGPDWSPGATCPTSSNQQLQTGYAVWGNTSNSYVETNEGSVNVSIPMVGQVNICSQAPYASAGSATIFFRNVDSHITGLNDLSFGTITRGNPATQFFSANISVAGLTAGWYNFCFDYGGSSVYPAPTGKQTSNTLAHECLTVSVLAPPPPPADTGNIYISKIVEGLSRVDYPANTADSSKLPASLPICISPAIQGILPACKFRNPEDFLGIPVGQYKVGFLQSQLGPNWRATRTAQPVTNIAIDNDFVDLGTLTVTKGAVVFFQVFFRPVISTIPNLTAGCSNGKISVSGDGLPANTQSIDLYFDSVNDSALVGTNRYARVAVTNSSFNAPDVFDPAVLPKNPPNYQIHAYPIDGFGNPIATAAGNFELTPGSPVDVTCAAVGIVLHPWLQTFNGDVVANGQITGPQAGQLGSRAKTATDKEAEDLIISVAGDGQYFCSTNHYILTNPDALSDNDTCSNGPGYNVNSYGLGSNTDDAVINAVEQAWGDNGSGSPAGSANQKCSPYNTFAMGNVSTVGTGFPGSDGPGSCINGTIIKWTGGARFLNAITVTSGRTTIWVSADQLTSGAVPGTLILGDNIGYVYSNYNDPRKVPNLAIVVEGNVSVLGTVTQLDAAIYATGKINTCANLSVVLLSSAQTCNSQLVVHGSLAARGGYSFNRVFTDGSAAPPPAELIQLTGQTVAFPPPGLDNRYQGTFNSAGNVETTELQPRF